MNRLAYHHVFLGVFLAFVVGMLGVANTAFAQPSSRQVADKSRGPSPAQKLKAKRYVDAGLVHQEEGEYEEAIRMFRKAYELIPHPQLLYNIGLAHSMAGHRQSALDYFRQYLAREPEGQWRAEANAAIAEIERELAEGVDPEAEAIARFDERHSALGADLDTLAEVAGQDAAAPLRERYDDIDAERVRDRAGTRKTAMKTMHALHRDVRDALTEARARAEAQASQAPGAGNSNPGGGAGRRDRSADSGRGSRMLGWTFLGVGTAALAVAGVSGLQAQSIADELSQSFDPFQWTMEEIERDRQGRAAGQRAVLFAGIGVVAITAGLVLYMKGRNAKKKAERALLWSPTAGDGQVGVTLSGSF